MNSSYSHLTLEKAEETLQFILNIVSEGVWDWDVSTGQVYRSEGWFKMLEYDINCFDQTVHTWENIIHPDDYARVMEHFESYIHGKTNTYKIQYRCRKADNSYLWIEDSAKIFKKDKNGNLLRMIGAHTNIHEFKLAQEKLFVQNKLLLTNNKSLEQLIDKRTEELENLNKQLQIKIEEAEYNSTHDYLTGLYNRRMFEEMFDIEVKRAKRYRHELGIILLDIDDFKLFNDKYGHKKGDEVLIKISEFLTTNVRESDIIARWGGEEFIILLPNSTEEKTYQKAEELRLDIQKNMIYKSDSITCSFGVTRYSNDDTTITVFNKADNALYLSKNNGKNKVIIAP